MYTCVYLHVYTRRMPIEAFACALHILRLVNAHIQKIYIDLHLFTYM